MELAVFVGMLRSSRTVRLETASPAAGLRSSQLQEALSDLYLGAALACPGRAPELDVPAAVAGARLSYEACRYLAFRELGESTLTEDLAVPAELERESPAVMFSLDLTLRCLPDVHRLARAAATNDPLVAQLEALGAWLPLSSVGMKLLELDLPEGLVADAALSRLYVDRIVEARAFDRLTDERLLALARTAVAGGGEDEMLRAEIEACG